MAQQPNLAETSPSSPTATACEVAAGTPGGSGPSECAVYRRVLETYTGSNGDRTKALYADLEQLGPAGVVALNLFRAQKCSERAKVYRGRGYKDMAYGRKNWSMDNLCSILAQHAEALGIAWGWKLDPAAEVFQWVLYVDTPSGQISFHSRERGKGPDYAGEWDQACGVCPSRVVAHVTSVIKNHEQTAPA